MAGTLRNQSYGSKAIQSNLSLYQRHPFEKQPILTQPTNSKRLTRSGEKFISMNKAAKRSFGIQMKNI